MTTTDDTVDVLRGQVAILREALEAFLAAWGPIHAHPDWADPSVTRHSPLAVGITVAVALQARTALAATDPGVCPGGGGEGHTAGRERERAAIAIVREVAGGRDLCEAVYRPGVYGGNPDYYCVICHAGLDGEHAPDCLVSRARALIAALDAPA